MLSWWGKSPKKDTTTETIVNLRAHIETLQKKAAFSEEKRAEQERQAKKLVTTNKTAARNALKRKKRYEEEIERLQNQIDSLETQLATLESTNMNQETLKYMKQGADAMKNINKGMDIDTVDETMDNIRDQLALNEEISNAISQPIQETDDAELEADLAELEQEALDEQVVQSATGGRAHAAEPSGAYKSPDARLPEVPRRKPQTEEEDEEEALRQLEAEMAA